MQIDKYDPQEVIALINESHNIGVIPSKVSGADAFCAAAGFYHMLKQKYDQKEIKFVYSGKIPEKCENIVNTDELSTNVSERDLVVSIDYSGISNPKAYHYTENQTLYLKIGPVPKEFETNRVKAKIVGYEFDLVFVVGAQTLDDLGPIYNHLRQEIKNSKIINLDNSSSNRRFGVVNIIDTSANSLSMAILKTAVKLDIEPDKKAANALLTGINLRNGINPQA